MTDTELRHNLLSFFKNINLSSCVNSFCHIQRYYQIVREYLSQDSEALKFGMTYEQAQNRRRGCDRESLLNLGYSQHAHSNSPRKETTGEIKIRFDPLTFLHLSAVPLSINGKE